MDISLEPKTFYFYYMNDGSIINRADGYEIRDINLLTDNYAVVVFKVHLK